MALPDYLKIAQGTAIVWGQNGGTGVTKDLSFNNLASTKARMGVYADLGATFEEELAVIFIVETGTAPTAGLIASLFFACSYDGSAFPGGVTGSDAAYKDAEETEWLNQLGAPVVSLIATNDGNVTQHQAPVIYRPRTRYIAPVIYNQLGVAFRNQGTPADNTGRVIAIPRRYLIED